MNMMCKKCVFVSWSVVEKDLVFLLSYGFDMFQKNIESSFVVIMDFLGV